MLGIVLDNSIDDRWRRQKAPLVGTLVSIVTFLSTLVAQLLKVADYKDCLVLELGTETWTGCLGWVGGRIHDHLSACCCLEDGALEEAVARTSAAWQPLERKRRSEQHL